jgi:hypothetical protein
MEKCSYGGHYTLQTTQLMHKFHAKVDNNYWPFGRRGVRSQKGTRSIGLSEYYPAVEKLVSFLGGVSGPPQYTSPTLET